SDSGYSVEWFRNGKDALDWLRDCPADLILLDLMMPVMDGWEFRAAQRADRAIAGIPVVVLTADTGAKAAAIHAEVCLHQPFRARELVDTVERVLVEDARRRGGGGGPAARAPAAAATPPPPPAAPSNPPAPPP